MINDRDEPANIGVALGTDAQRELPGARRTTGYAI